MKKKLFGYEFFEQIQKIAKIGAWELDVKTGQTHWSKEVYAIHGVPTDIEFNKIDAVKFYAPEERERVNSAIQEGIEKAKSWDGIFRFIDAKGINKWVRSIGSPMIDEDGNVIKLFGVFQDITGSFEREQENKFVLEATGMGLWRWDIINNHLYWDESLYNIYGVRKKDFTGAYEAWEATIHPQAKDKAEKDLKLALTVTGELDTTFMILKPSGETAFIGARGRAYYDEDHRPVKMYGVNWDRTAEIVSQRELDEQKKLANRNAKFASIGQLSAGVGHEINNPLAIIKGQMEIIEFQVNQKIEIDPIELIERFSKIDKSIHRIQKIVNGLRTFAREGGGERLVFNTSRAVQLSLDLIEEIYKKDGVHILRSGEGFFENLYTIGSEDRFHQVLMNLLSNAKDAVENEMIKEIGVEHIRCDGSVLVIISNSGKRISDDIAERVFDPFFTTKDIGQGTGIGLTISKNFIEEFGGSLELLDRAKTSFCIKVPLSTECYLDGSHGVYRSSNFEEVFDDERLHYPLDILVVDDEEDLGLALKTRLELSNCNVEWVGDGLGALKFVRENINSIDLILSDLKMPGLSGPELFKEIKLQYGADRPVFILMSGMVGVDQDKLGGVSTDDFDGIISKPFEMQDLLKTIKNLFPEQN